MNKATGSEEAYERKALLDKRVILAIILIFLVIIPVIFVRMGLHDIPSKEASEAFRKSAHDGIPWTFIGTSNIFVRPPQANFHGQPAYAIAKTNSSYTLATLFVKSSTFIVNKESESACLKYYDVPEDSVVKWFHDPVNAMKSIIKNYPVCEGEVTIEHFSDVFIGNTGKYHPSATGILRIKTAMEHAYGKNIPNPD